MTVALDILALVAVVGFVAGFARRLGWPEPLVLVVVGIGLSFVPHFLDIPLTPDLVLIGLLPPLLYAAAIRTSLVDFKANRRAILLLSVGLVAFSTVAVGLRDLVGRARASRWRRASPSARWSRRRTPWPRPPSRAGSACRGASSRSSRARAWSTTRRPWSR